MNSFPFLTERFISYKATVCALTGDTKVMSKWSTYGLKNIFNILIYKMVASKSPIHSQIVEVEKRWMFSIRWNNRNVWKRSTTRVCNLLTASTITLQVNCLIMKIQLITINSKILHRDYDWIKWGTYHSILSRNQEKNIRKKRLLTKVKPAKFSSYYLIFVASLFSFLYLLYHFTSIAKPFGYTGTTAMFLNVFQGECSESFALINVRHCSHQRAHHNLGMVLEKVNL